MSQILTKAATTIARQIEYLSSPSKVPMADQWYEIANLDHFWIHRRFEVLERFAGDIVAAAEEISEVGCGHGLLQRQIEDRYAKEVTGFDLNEYALKLNLSRRSRVCCYDISQKEMSFQGRYNVILVFDVLEHISDEDSFLQAVIFHLAPGGKIIVNIPAGQWAFSAYDVAAGHVRRYSIDALKDCAERNQLMICDCSYWGLPLVPTVAIRKLWLLGKQDSHNIIATGFDSRTPIINSALRFFSKWEWIPQKLGGTSLMAVLQRRTA